AVARALDIVDDMQEARSDLETPDRHRVVDADVPGAVDRIAMDDVELADPAFPLGALHFLAPVSTEARRREAAEVLLLDQGISGVLAENGVIFCPLRLDGLERYRLRIVHGLDFSEPGRIIARHHIGLVRVVFPFGG